MISPLIPLGGAVLAYALADEDQAMLLTAAGIVHVIMALTFVTGRQAALSRTLQGPHRPTWRDR